MSIKKLALAALLGGLAMLLVANLGCGPKIGRSTQPTYNADREQIGAAVAEFMQRPTNLSYYHTIGEVPIVNNTVIEVNGTNVAPDKKYYVVAICPLLTSSTPKGILKMVPATTHPNNCIMQGANAETSVTACLNRCEGSYVWLTTTDGDIASICIGDECANHNEDGFQDVYP